MTDIYSCDILDRSEYQNHIDSIAIRENLFTWPSDNPELLGSKCPRCQWLQFPFKDHCPRGCSLACQLFKIGSRGKLWTWTIQSFPPKLPYLGAKEEDFIPYGVGYIEMPCGVKVESPLIEKSSEELSIGREMELVLRVLSKNSMGQPILSYAFKNIG